jgi:hypothetical protein
MKKIKLTKNDSKNLAKSLNQMENSVLKNCAIEVVDNLGGLLFNRHSSWNQFDRASSFSAE